MDKDFIKHARKRIEEDRELSQAGLARALGKSPSLVSRMLRGETHDADKYFPAIRRYLGEFEPAGESVMLLIDEIALRGEASFEEPHVIEQWHMPMHLFDLPAIPPKKAAQEIKIVKLTDDSNSPAYLTGDYVFVYRGDRNASMGAPYLIWDGQSSFIIRRCEPIPGSKPAIIRLKPLNPDYDSHDITYDKSIFIGRIVGHYRKPSLL